MEENRERSAVNLERLVRMKFTAEIHHDHDVHILSFDSSTQVMESISTR